MQKLQPQAKLLWAVTTPFMPASTWAQDSREQTIELAGQAWHLGPALGAACVTKAR